MAFEFRYLDDASDRNRRDYLIMRDYVKAVKYITEIFTFIRSQELQNQGSTPDSLSHD